MNIVQFHSDLTKLIEVLPPKITKNIRISKYSIKNFLNFKYMAGLGLPLCDTEENAISICDNWNKKNQRIYRYLIKELF